MVITMSGDMGSQVHAGLRALAERNHDATNTDQTGFHRLDAAFGCALASDERLNLAEVVIAARLLRRYQRALAVPLPDEATIINWAIEQEDEVIGTDETVIAAELADRVDHDFVVPVGESSAQEEDQAEADKKSTPDRRVYMQRERIFVEFPYDRTVVQTIQPLKEAITDCAFDHYHRREWSFPQGSAWTVYEVTRGFQGFVYSADAAQAIKHAYRKECLEDQAHELEQHWQELAQLSALEAAQPHLDGAPTANGQRLFRHQREAVQRMIEAQRFILAHDMGLGKSRSALIAAQAYDLPIWVIVPAGLIVNWEREAIAAGVQVTLFSWAKLPDTPDFDYVLVADECHYAQGGEQTQRGQGFLQLADKARAVFMLSGTPVKNSLPINLWPLLVAAKHPLGRDRSAYEKRYCGAYYRSLGRKKSVYETGGATNLDELHELTRDVILYKKKSECIDLPDKLRTHRPAEVSQTGEVAYRKTIERLREEHLSRMADKYKVLGEDLLGEGTEEHDLENVEPAFISALVELCIYRHAASLAKVENAVEIAQEAMQQGQGVLLFTAFRDTAERLATKLGVDCLTGEVKGPKRQAMIDRFQAEESRALVATIGAGGIGVNLTAAQIVVLVDRPWTSSDAEQAEDRSHRLGQVHNVLSIWLQYSPVDERVDALLALKQERIEAILRGRVKNLRGAPGIQSLAKEIMESVRTGQSLASILGLDESEFEEKVVDLVRDVAPTKEQGQGSKKDGRLKGRVKRLRRNIMLDEEIVAFLETMKAPHQATSKEGGYSGFLERLVRQSTEYQAYQSNKQDLQKQEKSERESLENPLSSSVQ